jgi:hypothetical protein
MNSIQEAKDKAERDATFASEQKAREEEAARRAQEEERAVAAKRESDLIREKQEAEEVAPPPASLAQLQERLADLRAQRKEAAANFETDEQIRLTEEIEDTQIAMLRAEQAETVTRANVADYQGQYHAAVDAMEEKYSAYLDDDSSPFAEMLDDKIEAARARKDPRLADPRHIIAFADELAAKLGIGAQPPAATAAPTAPRKPAPIPPPPARAPIGSGVSPAGASKPQLTGRQAEAMLDKVSQEMLAAALWE